MKLSTVLFLLVQVLVALSVARAQEGPQIKGSIRRTQSAEDFTKFLTGGTGVNAVAAKAKKTKSPKGKKSKGPKGKGKKSKSKGPKGKGMKSKGPGKGMKRRTL